MLYFLNTLHNLLKLNKTTTLMKKRDNLIELPALLQGCLIFIRMHTFWGGLFDLSDFGIV